MAGRQRADVPQVRHYAPPRTAEATVPKAAERCQGLGSPISSYPTSLPGFDALIVGHRWQKPVCTTGDVRRCSSHHNLSKGEYKALLNQQAGKCAICDRIAYLYADHDHASGFNRGLLCGPCNSGLGMFDDSFDRFERAVAYLHKWRETQFASALSGFLSRKR